jgi:predicted kinase
MDDWMATLFHADRPEHHDWQWALERMARCEEQMWSIADRVVAAGYDVVFDLGLGRREDRERLRARAAQTRNGEPKFHFLDVGAETRRARVHRRNEERGETYAFEVSDRMFDRMEAWFEPPTDDELYGAMIIGGD